MSLEIPGPSPSRPASAAVGYGPSPSQSRKPPQQHRASHQVVSSTTSPNDPQTQTSSFTDVYSHPAAVAFAAAHPRRTIPKFGPYLLLQTLGEGEFGKVKLGLHSQWGEEVAVKLIRRGNVDTAVRMSKVEREIEVLRTLKHPSIVRLYDVIETDKYIGIIIEYASGGELFDFILAHRYLRERDASKLFSQLISGVWYIHQKKIVHRDLKLENLLLDRHRNVIITDFGFANRFEHKADDLMQTSCGSPCYAAPELVISEGLYVGSAVDIWSCGVILYAMLAGYLPFDDDPANPDGDNINLLYKYIVNTPLSFPDYISDEARDLLKMMLVPDPRKRASLEGVMRHPWLAAYHVPPTDPTVPNAFGRTVEELEKAAIEQHQMKRLAYQRQMRATANGNANPSSSVSRSQTQVASQSQRSRRGQPEMLYDSSSAAAYADNDEDPFAAPPGSRRPADNTLEEGVARGEPRQRGNDGEAHQNKDETETTPKKGKEKEDKFRHTIQVEYDSQQRVHRPRAASPPKENDQSRTPTQSPTREMATTPTPSLPVPVSSSAPVLSSAPLQLTNAEHPLPTSSPNASIAERKERRRRGSASSSGVASPAKPLPPSPSSPPTTWKGTSSSVKNTVGTGDVERPTVMDVFPEKDPAAEKLTPQDKVAPEKEATKKNRRNTLTGLTVMVNPINSIRANMSRKREPSTTTNSTPSMQLVPPTPQSSSADKSFDPEVNGSGGAAMKASTTKARTVMQWIRKGRNSMTVTGNSSASSSVINEPTSTAEPSETSPVQVVVTTPSRNTQLSPIATNPVSGGRKTGDNIQPATSIAPTPTSATPSFTSRFRRSINIGGGGTVKEKTPRDAPSGGSVLRVHHGAVDTGTITSGQPPEVMRHVKAVLEGMGVEIQIESEYKFRCIRGKQRRRTAPSNSTGPGVAAFTMTGSAASNGVDKRGLPLPAQNSFSGGGMLRGLLMRRQSSQVSSAGPGSTSLDGDDPLNNSGILTSEPASLADTVYGESSEDAGDEVRFSVELTRIDRITDMYSLDIRRLKGNLRSYKFLYDTLKKRADLQR
ncbi:Non-specific serine/threonine protein kinase [Mycena indigotica]|uniref:non-specific serine/threonine protein kinase n=1 Tax=Mycena indigotica TaxID=2126181 RepID=A0A8H6T4V9_9AGAR|nr:Non-specific serine/threonine protein kinase [Mycena indigotica]KAF7312140.1 Non-specific serine/threonine protein kinase [Mycena indigotica]